MDCTLYGRIALCTTTKKRWIFFIECEIPAVPNTYTIQSSIPVCRQMHNTETMLQERLAAEVNYATDPQELSRILVAMQDMPNIDRQKIDDAFDVMRIAVELSK